MSIAPRVNAALCRVSRAAQVGITMFLLPPVPGLPIYLTGGILLVAKGQVCNVM